MKVFIYERMVGLIDQPLITRFSTLLKCAIAKDFKNYWIAWPFDAPFTLKSDDVMMKLNKTLKHVGMQFPPVFHKHTVSSLCVPTKRKGMCVCRNIT